jgi:dTDP-4-amino-4,6-dideoxy-D-galactose acyltransferase
MIAQVEGTSLCQFLQWDSDFFERKIARLVVTTLTQGDLERALAWCRSNSIDCLYFLAEVDDVRMLRLAEDHGFRNVDTRMTFQHSLETIPSFEPQDPRIVVRHATQQDIAALRAIARQSHHTSRFYYDPQFSREQCNRLYERWIERSCDGYADAVLVADAQRQPVGYVTCHRVDPAHGQIGLIGINEAWRGQGLGSRLVSAALAWFLDQGANQATVVTQGRNCRAQRLYQRCGFLTRSVQLWYHRWFVAQPEGAVSRKETEQ